MIGQEEESQPLHKGVRWGYGNGYETPTLNTILTKLHSQTQTSSTNSGLDFVPGNNTSNALQYAIEDLSDANIKAYINGKYVIEIDETEDTTTTEPTEDKKVVILIDLSKYNNIKTLKVKSCKNLYMINLGYVNNLFISDCPNLCVVTCKQLIDNAVISNCVKEEGSTESNLSVLNLNPADHCTNIEIKNCGSNDDTYIFYDPYNKLQSHYL